MIDKNDVRCCKLLSHVCKSQTPPLTGINMRKEPQGTNEIESSGREASVAAVIDTCISGSELRADIKGKTLWGAPCHGKRKRWSSIPCKPGERMRNSSPASCLQKWCCVCELCFIWWSVLTFLYISARALASGAVGYRRDKGKFCELPHTLFVPDLRKSQILLLSVCHQNQYRRIAQTALDRQ